MSKITPPTLMLFCLLVMIALHFIMPFGFILNWVLLIFGVGFISNAHAALVVNMTAYNME